MFNRNSIIKTSVIVSVFLLFSFGNNVSASSPSNNVSVNSPSNNVSVSSPNFHGCTDLEVSDVETLKTEFQLTVSMYCTTSCQPVHSGVSPLVVGDSYHIKLLQEPEENCQDIPRYLLELPKRFNAVNHIQGSDVFSIVFINDVPVHSQLIDSRGSITYIPIVMY